MSHRVKYYQCRGLGCTVHPPRNHQHLKEGKHIFFVLKPMIMAYYIPTRWEGAILQSPCPSVRLSVRSHFRNRYLSFYWKKWFYIWYMALAWWLVPCLHFPGLPHIYFLFTVRLRIFHVCRNKNFRNSYLSFYWKKWFYIWYMAFAWWLVLCLPFPGFLHIYFLFTVRLTNERVGVFLARHSMQHLVWIKLDTNMILPLSLSMPE
jgi:hypothetical protein